MLRRPPRPPLFPYTTLFRSGQARRRPRYERFSLVAGVPFGGLQLAIAYALQTDTSLVYVHPARAGDKNHRIEGRFVEGDRSEEHTSELQSHSDLVCRLLLEK